MVAPFHGEAHETPQNMIRKHLPFIQPGLQQRCWNRGAPYWSNRGSVSSI
jgi:hypothetical protein